VAVISRPRGSIWLPDDMAHLRLAGVDTLVSLLVPGELRELHLEAEADEAVRAGLSFVSLPVPDLSVPVDTHGMTAGLLALRDEVLLGRTVVAHCREGVGRSTLCIAGLLVLLGVRAADAWQRIRTVRGRDVPDTAAQGRWVEGLEGWPHVAR
jgi:protein-tyrosine phosphatase